MTSLARSGGGADDVGDAVDEHLGLLAAVLLVADAEDVRELTRRVEMIVGHPPLSELSDLRRRQFHEALLEAGSFEDLPGKWQAAIVEAERNRPKLRVVGQRPKSTR